MYHGLSFVNHQNCEMNRTLSICKVAHTRVYCLFHTSRSCNRIPLYNSHDHRVYIPSLCIVYLQDGRVNRIPLCNSHDRRVYIPSSCVVYLQDGRVNRLFRNAHNGRVYISSAINVAFVGSIMTGAILQWGDLTSYL